MSELFGKLKALDAFPKVNEDFYQRTFSGGVITIGSSLIMLALFLSEFSYFLTVRTVNELSVDLSRGEQMDINFEITFPALPCGWLSLDAMDVSGEMHLDVDHSVFKQRLKSTGEPVVDEVEQHKVGPEQDLTLMHGAAPENETKPCGSCYGATGDCCNTCEEVRAAYRKRGWAFTDPQHIDQCAKEGYVTKLKEQEGEGCRMWGLLNINKVAGNFHFAPGRSFQSGGMHVHDLVPFGTSEFDTSHTIQHLSFGKDYPGMRNPLDNIVVPRYNSHNPDGRTGMYQYFLKVVPTVYVDRHNHSINTNQYSVTEHYKSSDVAAGHNLPGVFFFYDLSPIKVKYFEEKTPFLHFLTSVCAIVGGVFTVSGIVDSFVYHGQQAIRKKIDLGKFS
ncbi:hypothetical protein WJX73_008042 [Symbiochloris irregularis]|uniref:Endoplasmic reticulum-Golgi intermediate compartment protein 3 n=1 Tax=Symbiochloris irregularis TaxID=706552 RepID=A0AAW1NZJ1_9CHLO